MEEKLYSIADIAEELQLSKAYIYRKVNEYTKELKPYIKKVKNVTFLSFDGFTLLREKLNGKKENNEPQQQLIEALKEEIEFLREQLRNQTEIVKREQQLRMTESQNLLILEQHIRETDEKISLWREESLQKNKDNKVGFFNRFFKK